MCNKCSGQTCNNIAPALDVEDEENEPSYQMCQMEKTEGAERLASSSSCHMVLTDTTDTSEII